MLWRPLRSFHIIFRADAKFCAIFSSQLFQLPLSCWGKFLRVKNDLATFSLQIPCFLKNPACIKYAPPSNKCYTIDTPIRISGAFEKHVLNLTATKLKCIWSNSEKNKISSSRIYKTVYNFSYWKEKITKSWNFVWLFSFTFR